jgi:anaerobic selenocysteine-containing dehydrogenase
LAQDLINSDAEVMSGITWERLKHERSIKLNLPQPFRPYAEGSHFPDRKIRFTPAPTQIAFQEQPTNEFPLRLISPPGPFILNTSMGNLESIRKAAGGEHQVIIHPEDAARFGIFEGSLAMITSERGSIERRVSVSTDACPGTLIALGQWWPKLTRDKKSLNDLTSQRLTDLGGGSTFGNPVVRIEAV